MKFEFDAYDSNHVMLCPTEESAKYFVKFLDSLGRSWRSGASYTHHNNWERHKEETCYRFTNGEYSSLRYFESEGYVILNFYDFDWDGFSAKPDTTISMSFEEMFFGIAENKTTI